MTTLKGKHVPASERRLGLPSAGIAEEASQAACGTEASCSPGARHLPSVCAAHGEDPRLRLRERGEPLQREISAGSFARASSGSSESAELLATLLPFPPPQPSLGHEATSPLQTPKNPQPEPRLSMKLCVIRTHRRTKAADDTTLLGLRALQSPVFRTARGAGVRCAGRQAQPRDRGRGAVRCRSADGTHVVQHSRILGPARETGTPARTSSWFPDSRPTYTAFLKTVRDEE